MTFLRSLVHSDDPAADSIVVCGLALCLGLIGFEAWDVVAKGHEFAAMSFATAGGVLLGAIGGGKALRGTTEAKGA